MPAERDGQVTPNNYKQYEDSLVEQVALIQEAKEIGFTLTEIKAWLEDWYGDQLSVARKAGGYMPRPPKSTTGSSRYSASVYGC